MATREQINAGIIEAGKRGDLAALRALKAARDELSDAPPPPTKTDQILGFEKGLWKPLDNAALALEGGMRTVGLDPDAIAHRLGGLSARESMQQRDEYLAKQKAKGVVPGKTGEIVGNTVSLIPLSRLPGGPITQGAAGGALLTDDRSAGGVATSAGLGAAGGAVIKAATPYVAAGLTKLGSLVAPAAKAGAETLGELAARLGIKPTPATGGGAVTNIVQKALEATPGGRAAVQRGADREMVGLETAAKDTAAKLGPVGTPQSAGEAIAKGAAVVRRGTGAKATALYNARDAALGESPILTDSTQAALAAIKAKYPTAPALQSIMEDATIARISKATPGGPDGQLTMGEAADALSHVRGVIRNAMKGAVTTPRQVVALRQLEAGINADIQRAATSLDAITGKTGAASAAAMQKAADQFYSQRMGLLNGALKPALQSADDPIKAGGEGLYRKLLSDAGREGGNYQRLATQWGALPKAQRMHVAATVFDDLGRASSGAQNAAGDAWSFNTFLTKWDKLSPDARKLMFGGRGVDQQVNDIAEYAARLKAAQRGTNWSGTAHTAAGGAYVMALAGALFTGHGETAAQLAAALPASYAAARVFMTPALRGWTRQALILADKARASASPAVTQEIKSHIGALTAIAENSPALKPEIMAIQQRLTAALNPVAAQNVNGGGTPPPKQQGPAQQPKSGGRP